MRARIISKGIPAEKVMVITDWADTSEIKPVLRNENPLASRLGFKDHFIIMHSGNIGFSQDFSSLMRSVPMVKNASRLKLVFIGAGAARETLDREIEALGFENVVFLPFQPSEMLSYSLGMADLHIIALKAGMAGAIVPSKVYGIMAAGRPYLAITDKESEPARLIEECGCGLWAPPGDTKAIAGAIEWAMANKDKLEEMGRRGRRAAEERFDKEVVIRKWLELLAGFDYFCV
jgi:glycosyltransferase involved in cell wall biosynthesis